MTSPGQELAATLVRPLSGRVVDPAWAARVVSPLHDALTPEQRRELQAANPDTYLHVTTSDTAGAQQRLVDLGAYRPRTADAVYAYRMSRVDGSHTGLVAEVSVAGFADGRVLGHEAVQPARVEGLVRHFDGVPRRSELVSLVHRDDGPLAERTARLTASGPLLELVDLSGLEQTVWAADPDTSRDLVDRLEQRQLYIADGHHRVAAALQRWLRDGQPADATVLCALYPEREIQLFAFHRLVHGPVATDDLLARLAGSFEVQPASGPTQQRGSVGLYADRRWHRLAPRDRTVRPGVAGLDVTRLDQWVLSPLLGIERGDPRLEFVPELRGLDLSLAACDADGGVLFTLRAPVMDDLVATAERGEVMSAKSTYVEPKPRTGIFLTGE